MQTFTSKLSLLEELVEAEDDESSVQTLLENQTIGQMYKVCCSELPKLIQLANSDLAEDLMAKIITVSERMSALKARVEGKGMEAISSPCSQADLRLAASTEALNCGNGSSESTASVQLKSFTSNELLCWEVLQFASGKSVLRVMNISESIIFNIKMVILML